MGLDDPKHKKLLDDFMMEHAPLIQKHINILKSQKKIPPHVEEEDLHFAGFHGLMDALHRYDGDIALRNTKQDAENSFSKYAERRIRGKMLDHIVNTGDVPKVHQTRAKNLAKLPGQED